LSLRADVAYGLLSSTSRTVLSGGPNEWQRMTFNGLDSTRFDWSTLGELANATAAADAAIMNTTASDGQAQTTTSNSADGMAAGVSGQHPLIAPSAADWHSSASAAELEEELTMEKAQAIEDAQAAHEDNLISQGVSWIARTWNKWM